MIRASKGTALSGIFYNQSSYVIVAPGELRNTILSLGAEFIPALRNRAHHLASQRHHCDSVHRTKRINPELILKTLQVKYT